MGMAGSIDVVAMYYLGLQEKNDLRIHFRDSFLLQVTADGHMKLSTIKRNLMPSPL